MARAQQAGTRRIDLQRHDLSVPGREVVQTIVELDPGVTSSRHTHPGEEIVYVLEGAPQVEGKPSATLKPGDVLFIPARTVHAAKNVGSRKGAELATYIVEKGNRSSPKSVVALQGDRAIRGNRRVVVLGGGVTGATARAGLASAPGCRDHSREPRVLLGAHTAPVRGLFRQLGAAALRAAHPRRFDELASSKPRWNR